MGFVRQPVAPQFNTREFRQSDGPGQHNAASAWTRGATGQGVTIGIIDTGIDPDSPEFVNRLSPASTDIFGTRPLEGPDDHGTLVTLVAAAERNNTGVLGIAWDATILAIRADQPGTCGTDNPQDPQSECSFPDTAIADSVDYAVANGAKVINISLGGPGGISQRLQTAVRAAVDAGTIVVVAAGNDGLSDLQPFGERLGQAGDGGLIVVGSVDEDYAISDFSNRAGDTPQFYLTARGETICCVYEDGEIFVDDEGFIYLFSGTSFASPQVAGAAALLAQAFPNLTGREIAEILLQSAFDAGDSGPDAIYGMGILDIAAAFQPIGTTSLAGESTPLPLGDVTGVASPAMGDALSRARLSTIVTDRYDRAFETDLAGTLRSAAQRQVLHGALANGARHVAASGEGVSLSFSVDENGARPLQLTGEEAELSRVLAARVAMRVAPQTQMAFGYAQGANGLAAQLQGQERPAFMIASTGAGDSGMVARSDAAFAVRHQLGNWGLTASAERGSAYTASEWRREAELAGRVLDENFASYSLSVDRAFGPLAGSLGLTWQDEGNTVLGARFHEGFGLSGSDSLFVDIAAGWQLTDDWRLAGNLRKGWTTPRNANLLAETSRLTSNAWSLDLARSGVFGADDRLALRLSQPLRVTSGGLDLNLPVAYDYVTLTPDYAVRTLSLSPEGRELTGELAWRGGLWGGFGAASLFYRSEPGHVAGAPADMGFAVRWSRGF